MNELTHIIQKVFVEVNTKDVGLANRIKNDIRSFLMNDVFPILEKMLDSQDRKDSFFRLERLNVTIEASGFDNRDYLRQELLTRIEQHLLAQMEPNIHFTYSEDRTSIVQLSREKNNEELFLFFIEKGYLPWYGNENEINQFETDVITGNIRISNSFTEKLAQVLRQDKAVAVRLASQFQMAMVKEILLKIYPDESKLLTALNQLQQKYTSAFKTHFLILLLQISATPSPQKLIPFLEDWFLFLHQPASGLKNKSNTLIAEAIRLFLSVLPEKIIAHSSVQPIVNESLSVVVGEKSLFVITEKMLGSEEKTDKAFFENEEKEIAIQNTGLILLHPFLRTLFNTLKITGKNEIIATEKQDLAVQLLHFLATGNEDVTEANMVFEKFLCGIPLKMPVQKKSLLTPKMKMETKNLLEQAIKRWPALKNTSPEGLRQMFLQRAGKIIEKEKYYKIIVEHKAQDVLLERLPWNISMVKLPWVGKLIYVNWQ